MPFTPRKDSGLPKCSFHIVVHHIYIYIYIRVLIEETTSRHIDRTFQNVSSLLALCVNQPSITKFSHVQFKSPRSNVVVDVEILISHWHMSAKDADLAKNKAAFQEFITIKFYSYTLKRKF